MDVETSGISDPGAIAVSFLAFEEDNPDTNVYLSTIVTVVDADRIYRKFMTDLQNYDEKDENGLASNDVTSLIVDQMEFCNTIVLNKVDLLDGEQLAQVIGLIRDFQPKAEIITTSQGKVEIDRITSTQKFLDFINDDFPKELIRAKGYIWFKERPQDVLLFEQAGRNTSVMPVAYWVAALDEQTRKECLESDEDLRNSWDPEYGDRMNQIVFIGKDYDKEKIVSRLERCLAS